MGILVDGAVLRVRGEVDGAGLADLRSQLYRLLEPEDCEVVVDLAEAEGVDVHVLRTLAVASRIARRRGRRLRLRGCCPRVVDLLRRSRLIRVVDLEGPVPAAGRRV